MALLKSIDRPVLVAFGCILVLLVLGATQNRAFLSGGYLLQQLQVASFLGIIASGMMVVILLGHIDLSVPWVITIGGVTATAAQGWWGEIGLVMGLPVAVACGAIIGLGNGLGVTVLRVPSMVFTLGMNAVAQGLVVMYTGGNAPPDQATPLLKWLAVRHTVLNIPNALFVWALLGALIVIALHRTPYGRYVYAIGNSERVGYLSGVNTRAVLITTFVISGACAGLA